MASMTHTCKPVKQVACTCLQSPICPCEMFRQGKLGTVCINGQDYAIGYHGELPATGEPVIRGYHLTSISSGKSYDLSRYSCDCADCTYRQRKCKHLQAVEQLIADGDLCEINDR